MQSTPEKLFTKSAFKVALDCPWKLYYYRNPDQYANANVGDDFMEALAQGGFQVGELAKIYCGVDEDADLKDVLGYEESLERTQRLMRRDNVTIAEAAFRYKNLFVRVDILKKQGNEIELIEVKAKSWDKNKEDFWGKRPKNAVAKKIRPYVYDVAFQKYVVQNALTADYPGVAWNVSARLMMADKTKTTDINGLNQLFRIKQNSEGRTEACPTDNALDVLKTSSVQVLTPFDVDNVCCQIIEGKTAEQNTADFMLGGGFKEFVAKASDAYCQNIMLDTKPMLCNTCFKCEFHKTDATSNLQDGKRQCWLQYVSGKDYDTRPLLEKLNGSNIPRNKWVKEGIYFMDQITHQMKDSNGKCPVGLDYLERKWLQVGLETKNPEVLDRFRDSLQGNTYLDVEGLRQEMEKWTFPLHMIDFETTAVALPFYKGMRPYEQVAFQFSHHIIRREGNSYSIEHVGQYLNEDVSKFPNFEFVRELKRQLEGDNGTIFRYANHENSILNAIAKQLSVSNEPDKDDLISFIHLITHDKDMDRKGERDMVDLLEVVKRYYYNVDEMHGSNSIKQVLPAVLNGSQFLKNKYSQPIYGNQIKSLNIPASDPKAWVTLDANGHVESPYHLLESVGDLIGMTTQQMSVAAKLAESNEKGADDDNAEINVANGGEALAAYSKLMFCEDNKVMSGALRQALLRYCELDTMSMVFIWEYFNNECSKS